MSDRDWRDHLTSPSVLVEVLRRHGVTPQHRLGQHFLVDGNILGKIVDAARLEPTDAVVEVGAGLGTLTRVLGRRAGWVLAVELDSRLVSVLRETVSDLPAVVVHQGDALTLDWKQVLADARVRAGPGGRVVLMGNLPFYLTSPLLYRWLGEGLDWDTMVVTLQKEAAERLVAPPGGGAYGGLTVLAVVQGEVSLVAKVAPSCFYPRPRVWSAVVRLERRCAGREPGPLRELLRAAFGQRRKMLLNALVAGGLAADREEAAGWLKRAGIDPSCRAEQLQPRDFLTLLATKHGAEK